MHGSVRPCGLYVQHINHAPCCCCSSSVRLCCHSRTTNLCDVLASLLCWIVAFLILSWLVDIILSLHRSSPCRRSLTARLVVAEHFRMPVDQDKLNKLMASVRTGGKGSVRRKKKAVHKTATTGQQHAPRNRSHSPLAPTHTNLFLCWKGWFPHPLPSSRLPPAFLPPFRGGLRAGIGGR